MGITNRPSQSSSTNKEEQTLQRIHRHLSTELQKITPKEDASNDVKNLFKQFIELIDNLKD